MIATLNYITDIFTLSCLRRMYLMSLVQSGAVVQQSIFDAATALEGREETNLQWGTLCKPAFCIPLFSSRSLFLYLHALYSKFFRHTYNASYISNQYYNLQILHFLEFWSSNKTKITITSCVNITYKVFHIKSQILWIYDE